MSILFVDDIRGKTAAASVDLSNATNLRMPPGHVIQVVTYTPSSATTFSSQTMTVASTVNFTPKFNNSIIKHTFWAKTDINNDASNRGQDCEWVRDSTVMSGQSWGFYFNRSDFSSDYYPTLTWFGYDTPNTTSQVVYKFQGRTYGGSSGASWACYTDWGSGGARGTWIIEEISQ